MTQDEIIEMARHSGLIDWEISAYGNELKHFAKLVAQHEREACAGLCDRFANRMMTAEECADAIRARGDNK